MSDRRIRDRYPEILQHDSVEIPVTQVDFSLHWIESHQSVSENPISDIQFKRFMDEMERDIAKGIRKRIFDENDGIHLKPETIRGVVSRLESIFLFGIDVDLNGRLFETFLNATMRGKDLGQFFTPRSLVKLGVSLANIQVHVRRNGSDYHTDTLIDACCGSGGFLIDALAEMWSKVDKRSNLSQSEKQEIKKSIANNNIVGIDIANAPKLARIARLNMYLHGDGGTKIYHLDALDNDTIESPSDSNDIVKEKAEWRGLVRSACFDIALTNPPFAKAIDRSTTEERRILDAYQIGHDESGPRSSVRSALLFIERYWQMLRIGGRLVTVIDDGILSGDDYKWFRAKLKEWFLIRAVVSLPGDAFQRSNARVKTSYLVAEKRDPELIQAQPPVFMYPCQHVGIDDPKRQRARAGDHDARALADREIAMVSEKYSDFLDGKASEYCVAPDRVIDRLDVKNCLMKRNRKSEEWRREGRKVYQLKEVLEVRRYDEAEIIRKDHPEQVVQLVVRYEGYAEAGEEIYPAEGSYAKYFPVYNNDLVVSNIAAHLGSIAVISQELDGHVVSTEYTVLKAKDGFNPVILQMILRSPEIRAEMLLSASGANRTRTRWDLMRDIEIPYPAPATCRKIIDRVTKATDTKREAIRVLEEVRNESEIDLLLRSEIASTILAAFKPPK